MKDKDAEKIVEKLGDIATQLARNAYALEVGVLTRPTDDELVDMRDCNVCGCQLVATDAERCPVCRSSMERVADE